MVWWCTSKPSLYSRTPFDYHTAGGHTLLYAHSRLSWIFRLECHRCWPIISSLSIPCHMHHLEIPLDKPYISHPVISFSLAFMQSAQCHALPQGYICTISACLSCEGIALSRSGAGRDRRVCALVLALSPSSSFKGVLRWLSTLFAETLRVAQQSAKDSIHCFMREK